MNTFHKSISSCDLLCGFLTIIAAVSAVPAAANDQPKPLSQYLSEEWGTEKGFPGGAINAIAQTDDGYLWIGTQKGLIRFDGKNFRLFSQMDANGSSIGPVLGLLADNEGSLWVRLEGPGLLRYREEKFEDFTHTFDVPEIAITQMCRAVDGGAVLATIVNGTVAYRGGKFTSVARAPDLSDFLVTSMTVGPHGSYWLGTRDLGLFNLRDGRISPRRDVLAGRQVNVLLYVNPEQLWIGTDKGLFIWNNNNLIQIGMHSSLAERQILSLAKDSDSNIIWVGTDRGLYRLDPESKFNPTPKNTAGDLPVTAILADREGNVWTGTVYSLQRLRNTIFTTLGPSDGLPEESNGPVHVDTDGRIWFAPIHGGLYWLSGGQVSLIREAGINKDVVYSIAGGNGDLWVARLSSGLTHLQSFAGKWRSITYTKDDGLAQNSVYTVRLSRDGAVWAGTLSAGLTRIKNGKFETFTADRGPVSNTIASILESRDGTMWFATPRGLSGFSNNRWRSYSSQDGLPSDDVNCLFEDSAGTLWIGTMKGLAALRAGKLLVPAQGLELLREPIFGLQVDADGFLWIAGSNHVSMVSREKVLRPDFEGADMRQFDLADGLRTTDGVKRDETVESDSSGKIWFSLSRGLSVVDTARLRNDSAPSILHFGGLFVDGNPLPLHNPGRISPNPRRITINYAGISLSVPDRVKFKYKLDGFDKTWSDPATAPEVNYTNLNPGSYLFHVIASNSDGLWNGAELAVPFSIGRVFWATWWFQTSIVALVLFSAWLAYRYRLYQLAKQFNIGLEARVAERTRIARELHDTLLQSFQGLLLRLQTASNLLPTRPEEAKQKLDNTIDLAAQAITEGRGAVQGLRESTTLTNNLPEALSALGGELAADETKNHPVFEVDVEGEPRDLHPLLRDEVYRIAGEALRNAFRHAQANRIEVEIHYDAQELRLRIRDDGKGVAPQIGGDYGRAGHFGLHGMRERAKLIGGNLEIWSDVQSGTEIELTIAAAAAYARSAGQRRSWFSRKGKVVRS